MSKIDVDYAYGQAKLSKEAAKHCVFSIIGENFNGHDRLEKGFHGLSDIRTVFQEHIYKVVGFKSFKLLNFILDITKKT